MTSSPYVLHEIILFYAESYISSSFHCHLNKSNVVKRCLYSYRQRVRVITVVKMLWPNEAQPGYKIMTHYDSGLH